MHYGYPKIGVFGGFRGKNSKFYFSRPQKALPYAETRLLTYCAWKSVQRCGLYPSWRTAKQKYLGVHFTYMPGKTRLGDFYQNWAFSSTRRPNHPQQIWSKNLERFLICGGPKFRSSHLLRPSILQTGYRGSLWSYFRCLATTSKLLR